MISRNPRWTAPRKSSCRKVDDGWGMETIAEGQLEMPRSMPTSAVPTMPIRIAPLNFSRHQDQRQDEAEASRLHFAVGEASQADKRSGDWPPRVSRFAVRQMR